MNWIKDGLGFFKDGGAGRIIFLHNHQWCDLDTLFKSDDLLIGRYTYGRHCIQRFCVLSLSGLKTYANDKLPKKYHRLINANLAGVSDKQ